jgi:hypothetical protein
MLKFPAMLPMALLQKIEEFYKFINYIKGKNNKNGTRKI